MSIRIIPRLDVKGPNLVKGVHLEGLRVLGLPQLYATQYYQDGADEIIYVDAVASLYGRNNLEEVVRRAAEQIFVPLTVGGGVRSIKDINQLLRAGADKVAINTAAIRNPQLIKEAAHTFGSQCIVIYIEAKQRGPGNYECLTDNAREKTGVDVFDWARMAVDLGAGEILLTSVDREGTGKGYDIELTSRVASMVEVPVIASGGAANAEHVKQVIVDGEADAVCAASLFHYQLVEGMLKLESQFEEGNIEFLKRNLPSSTLGRRGITPTAISDLKTFLIGAGIPVRQSRPFPELQQTLTDGEG